MEIRKYDYKLKKELNSLGPSLSVSFDKDTDAISAAKEISKQYKCILFQTENAKYYNVRIPARKDGEELFDSKFARKYGKEICLQFGGNGFVTHFGDLTSYDEVGDLIGWMDGAFGDDEEELFYREEILAMQLAGVKDSVILNLSREDFCTLREELGETYDESLYRAKRIIKKEEDQHIYTISFCESYYPQMLSTLGDERPPLLHYIGESELLERTDSIAIIGARRADKMGNGAAYQLGTECAKRGKVVISGLALGCDGAAHQGCLDAHGETIAIVANGLDMVHPKEHKDLQDRIVKNGGLILSEHPIGVKASPTRLVARNRLQAALSEKVVVAQCPVKSGTMYTVDFAQKYSKKIYAVQFAKENEFNCGNRLLLQDHRALPTTKLWEL